METFDQERILERIAQTGDGIHAVGELLFAGAEPEELPAELKEAVEQLKGITGRAVGIDYADLGENSYDAYGIYCFLPETPEDPCRLFSIMITLGDEIERTGIFDLYQIMNRINAKLAEGAFVLSGDERILSYRYAVPLDKSLGTEETLRNVGSRMLQAIGAVSSWIDVLLGLNDGSMSYEEAQERTGSGAE